MASFDEDIKSHFFRTKKIARGSLTRAEPLVCGSGVFGSRASLT